jgi:hypothetical protein
MSNKRVISIQYNVLTSTLLDANGLALRSKDYPFVYFKEKPLVNLQLVIDEELNEYTGIPAGASFSVSIDSDFNHTSEVMARTANALINVAGDWDGGTADCTQGQLSIPLDAYTGSFRTKVGTAQEKTSTALEVLVFDPITAELIQVFRFPFRCLNIQDDNGEALPDVETDLLLRTEAQVLYVRRNQAAASFRTSADGKHLELWNGVTQLWHKLGATGPVGAVTLTMDQVGEN